MTVNVRFFASLREQVGQAEAQLDAAGGATAAQVWAQAAGQSELPPNVVIAVNQEYARPEQPVSDGDEVAFFPPVTGG